MNENDYLAHYGVLGMKWGVRKKQPVSNNIYTSRTTKKLKKKSTKAMLKSNNLKKLSENKNYTEKQRKKFSENSKKQNLKAQKLYGKSVASAKRDQRYLNEYASASRGSQYVNNLIGGPIGHTYVSSMKASGLSTGKARVMTFLSGAIGASYYKNKSIESEGKKYEKNYVNDGYYTKRRFR